MHSTERARCLGVLGGMGPLASAEFLKTVYEYNLPEREQLAPNVVLLSDPSFPDRTDAFLAGRGEEVLRPLVEALERLTALGATRIVICCVTAHHLLPLVPAELRSRVISLLDVVFEQVCREGGRHLLVCSSGSMRLGLFQKHVRWAEAARHIVLPSEADQEVIHRDLIYPMKTDTDLTKRVPLLRSLLKRYGVKSFIAGCSEIHMLAKLPAFSGAGAGFQCIDPLAVIARDIPWQTL